MINKKYLKDKKKDLKDKKKDLKDNKKNKVSYKSKDINLYKGIEHLQFRDELELFKYTK
tara:strand:+ start:202 stop:378 length:177 start_codon:yes stop_codon:yes gene_type:complete